MPQLAVPIGVWLAATPEERDQFYLQAGFDPMLPVVDSGTDATTVRFSQEYNPNGGPVDMQPGDDTRDFTPSIYEMNGGGSATVWTGVPGDQDLTVTPVVAPAIITGSQLAVRVPAAIRPQFTAWLSGRVVGSRVAYSNLPSWLRTALTVLGLTGATIAVDASLDSLDIPFDQWGPKQETEVDIQIQPGVSAQVVGSWVANGVTFYRLLDGKIAVQNKKGRWKVWRPKKPIVLYSDGASNLKTMLRADRALNKQAKKIAAMLNRRAPRPRKSAKSASNGIIVQGAGRVIDV